VADDAFYGLHAGRKDLRAMFERMFREGRDYAWRIAAYREYFDTGVALLQLGSAPDALARVLGRKLD
jgi:hypothetical protein